MNGHPQHPQHPQHHQHHQHHQHTYENAYPDSRSNNSIQSTLYDSARDRNELFGYSENAMFPVADLNARLFERRIQLSAEENPYAHWNRRQAWMSIIAKELGKNDPYTQTEKGLVPVCPGQ
jgi:hypothetical protein